MIRAILAFAFAAALAAGVAVAQQGTIAVPASTPGGSTTQLQYNNAGVFGGISGWTTNGTLALTGGASTTLAIGGATIGSNALAVTGASLFNSQISNILGTITTSQPFTLTQTWNAGGVTFNPFLINVTDTASAAASLLMDLQVGGVTVMNVQKGANGGITYISPSVAGFAAFGTRLSADTFNRLAFGLDSGAPFFGMGPGSGTRDVFISRSTTNVAQIGTTSGNALGTLLAANFTASALVTTANITATGLANTATTSALCYNTGTGVITYNSTVGTCTVSGAQFKNLGEVVAASQAQIGIDALRVMDWSYKPEYKLDDRAHVGLIADDVEKMDPRCVTYKDGQIQNYDDRCVLAYLIAVVQQQKREIGELKRR